MDPARKVRSVRPALRGAAIYVVVGFLWILFSDRILEALVPDPLLYARFQTFKGWLFILVTGILVYGILDRHFREIRASREALREKNRMLSTLFSNLPGMAYRCAYDRDWTMEFVSDGCTALTGYLPADLVGNRRLSYADLIHPDDREMVWNEVNAGLERDRPFRLVYRIRSAEGEVRWMWEQGRAVHGSGGEVEALEGFITDVTALKELEARLRQVQKLEAVGQLAGGVAHDFNNLLTAIGGYAALLERRVAADDKARRDVAEILKATEKGGALIAQLLAFSRRQPLEPVLLNVNTVVADLENMLGRLLGGRVGLVVHLSDTGGWVKADRTQLEQVLLNLAVNAGDAMPGGGTLTMAVEECELGPDEAGARDVAPGAFVRLRVSDTGTGMSERIAARIFEPFFTTKEEKGTGLGLATVYGIVKQSGGHIEVETQPGNGTTFRVYLPRSRKPGEAASEKRAVEPERPSGASQPGDEARDPSHPERGRVRARP